MARIFAVSAFGFRDNIATSCDALRSDDFKPSCIVFDGNNSNPIYGKFAKSSRIKTGLGHSEEALLNDISYKNINRALVSILWRKLSLTHKSDVKYNQYYRCSYLLAGHINHLITEYFKEHKISPSPDDQFVIVIPNEIDEYAQEFLLRELRKYTVNHLNNVTLVWRPIAALMYNLLSSKNCDLIEGNKIGVVYIGPDAFENSYYALERDETTGWLQPVRKRHSSFKLKYCGLDVISSIIKHDFSKMHLTDDLLWQLVNCGEDYWSSICDKNYEKNVLPYFSDGQWSLRKASALKDFNYITAFKFKNLCEITGEIYGDNRDGSRELSTVFTDAIFDKQMPDCVLVCGPMASYTICNEVSKDFSFSVSKRLKKNSIVLSDDYDDISCGAFIYLDRLNHKLPTYLDELPSLEIKHYDNNNQEWISETLVARGTTVRGGEEYKYLPKVKFKVQKNNSSMNIYLSQDIVNESNNDDVYDEEIRFGKADFKDIAKEDVILNLKVQMKPASGIAKVTFFSENSAYLPKEGFDFDYSTMEKSELPTINLTYPKELKRSYNRNDIRANSTINNIKDLIADTRNPNYILDQNAHYENFAKCLGYLNTAYKGEYFIDLDGNSNSVERQSLFENLAIALGKLVKGNPISVENLSDKKYSSLLKLFRKGSFLSVMMPKDLKSIYNHWLELLQKNKLPHIGWYFDSLCRYCYVEDKKTKCIFSYYVGNSFKDIQKNYISRGMIFLLNYSSIAKEYMTKELALKMVNCSILTIEEKLASKSDLKPQVITNSAMLLLMALKYRCKEPKFLNPQLSILNKDKVDLYFELLDKCIWSFKNKPSSKTSSLKTVANLEEIRDGVKAFIDGMGDQNFLIKIASESENEEEKDDS